MKSFHPSVIVIFFLLLAGNQAYKPLILDNIDFPAVAKATAQTGIPFYYRGEQSPTHSGLYHPPFYIYLLAGWYKAFGFSEIATRLFGAVMAILQCFLTIQILARLLPTSPVHSYSGFLYALFLLSPLTLANSSIADIDSTIYGPVLLAVVLAVLNTVIDSSGQRRDRLSLQNLLTILLLLVAAWWAKLTTTILIGPFMAVTFSMVFGVRRGLLISTSLFSLSIASFSVSYGIYGRLLHLDTGYTYRFLVYSLFEKGSLATPTLEHRLRNVFTALRYNIPFDSVWVGGLTIILTGVSLYLLFKYGRGNTQASARLLIPVLSLPVLSAFVYMSLVLPWGQCPSKYIFPFFGLFLAPIYCVFLLWRFEQFKSAYAFGVQWLYPCGLFIGALWIRDRLLWRPPQPILPLPLSAALASIWIPSVIALAGFALWARLMNKGTRVSLGKALFVFTAVSNAGLCAGIATFQARVSYSTTYSYGQLGIREAASYVRHKTAENEAIICMKDIGFLAGRPYWESYGMLFSQELRRDLLKKVDNEEVRYLVFTRRIGEDRLDAYPEVERQVRMVAEEEWQYGNYVIFRAKRKQQGDVKKSSSS